MRNDIPNNHNNSSSSSSDWMQYKQLGKEHFEQHRYDDALHAYTAGIRQNPPLAERQILLSNMVACRLLLHGQQQQQQQQQQQSTNNNTTTHLQLALQHAQDCIACNDQWAKGHVRLGSVYSAMGRSNDACNAYQRALQLDPSNPTARQELIRELRRDRMRTTTTATNPSTATNTATTSSTSSSSNSSRSGYSHPPPSAPPHEQESSYSSTTPPPRQSSAPPPQQQQQQQQQYYHQNNNYNNNYNNNNTNNHYQDIDDRISMSDRFKFYYTRAFAWYQAQSDDVKSILKVLFVIVLLYIAFGGRFGLEYMFQTTKHHQNHGNYEMGNAYDQFYQQRQHATTNRMYHDNSQQQRLQEERYNYKPYNDDDDYYYTPRQRRQSYSSSFSLFDGSLYSIMTIAGIAYMCHRNGINPLQALFFLNMLGGGGRRRFRRPGRFGWGYGGFGGGGFGQRRRNGWY